MLDERRKTQSSAWDGGWTTCNPKRVEWYDSGHGLPTQAYFDMVDWLGEQIGIDATKYKGFAG